MLLVAVQYFDSDQCYLVTAGLSQLAFQSVELGEGTAVWQAAMAQVPLVTAHGVRQAVLTRWHACVQRPQVTPLVDILQRVAPLSPDDDVVSVTCPVVGTHVVVGCDNGRMLVVDVATASPAKPTIDHAPSGTEGTPVGAADA